MATHTQGGRVHATPGADDLAEGRLVRPFALSRPADYAYYVVVPEGHAGSPRVRAFVDWLEEEAARSRLVTADR